MSYRKGSPPFSSNDWSTATPLISYHGLFDKYWSYVASSYTDDTTDAGDTDTADTQTLTNSGDIVYLGKTEKFDAVSWDLSTNGTEGTATWEYCSVVDGNTACTTWSALTLTNEGSSSLTDDGRVAFTAPSDWASCKVNSEDTAYYYVRIRATGNYSVSPIGTQFTSIPTISYAMATPIISSDTTNLIWNENGGWPYNIRYSSTSTIAESVAPVSPSELAPVVLGYSNLPAVSSGDFAATYPVNQKHLVKTYDGTFHAFIQSNSIVPSCGSNTNNGQGLMWIYSTDSGSSWVCGSELSGPSSSVESEFADAVADSSGNIYIVYSKRTEAGATKDVIYRKLTKGEGSVWTVGDAQTIFDAAAGQSYHNAVLELEGTTRLWVAAEYYNGTNYRIPIFYSDGLSATPNWTQSTANVDTAGDNGRGASLVRFGSNIAVVYEIGWDGKYWAWRADNDTLTTWTVAARIGDGVPDGHEGTDVIGDSSGHIYMAYPDFGDNFKFYYYNGSSWSEANISSSATDDFSGLETDGTNVWVLYGENTGLSSGLLGPRRMVYKKGVPPFAAENFDTNPTYINTKQTIFDKYWSYVSSSYTDDTTDAGDTGSADTQMITGVDDIAYFGKTEKFDAITWDLSTDGSSTGRILWEYWNGSAWRQLVDFYGTQNTNFAGDGYISFTPPSNWTTTQVNSEVTPYYYIRARVTSAFSTPPVGVEVTSIPTFGYLSVAESTAGIYAMWTENITGPARVRYQTIMEHNANPNVPSSLYPASLVGGGWTTDNTPTLTFTLSDTDASDTVKYQIQIDDSADFSSPLVDYTSALGAQGSASFTVGQAAGSGTYTIGSAGQTLTDGNYYWKVKTIDNSNAASSYTTANSGSIAFKVDATNPSAPGTPSISTASTDNTPTLSWSASSDSASGLATTPYTLEWSTDSTFASGVNTTTSTTNSYTHTTSLSDGTWYFRVKAADLAGNSSSYSANGSKVIDTTSPTAISLDQPSNNAYINYERPTFRWQASTDATLGISSYTLEVDNGESGDFTIANIPSSGNGVTTTDKYVLQYDNFNDSDQTNNCISIYTKSSSQWGSTENDGNLKEGKRSWTVKAEDSAGNIVSASRTLFVDKTNPNLGFTQINDLSFTQDKDSYETTDQTPELFIKITDPLSGNTTSNVPSIIQDNKVSSGPKSIELKIEKKDGLFYKLHTTYTINPIATNKFTCNDTDITNNTLQTCDKYFLFSYQVKEALGNGDYKFILTGKDEAGNSSDKTIYLKIGNFEKIATEEEQKEAKVEKEAPGQIEITKPSDEEPILDKKVDEIKQEYKESPLNKLVTPVISLIQRCLNFKANLVAKLAFNLGQKVESISLNPGLFIVKFGYLFVSEPTTIANVKLTKLSENSATISWTTNHPTTGKINYGKTEDYGQDVQTTKRTTYHEFTIENLDPQTTYYYEVMSQNKNYVFDAHHIFTTP